MAEKKNVSVGRRVTRALFMGMLIGIFGGLGLYILASGVNELANKAVLDATAFLLIGLGGSITGAIGIELSSDIAEG